MELVRSNVKVEWSDLGEGKFNPVYDPNDPEDIRVLRFDIYVRNEGHWEPVEEGSSCTDFPANSSEEVQRKALEHIMDKVHSPIKKGEEITALCRDLSWISPDWFEEEEDDVLRLYS